MKNNASMAPKADKHSFYKQQYIKPHMLVKWENVLLGVALKTHVF
jgi:hypothetical protein